MLRFRVLHPRTVAPSLRCLCSSPLSTSLSSSPSPPPTQRSLNPRSIPSTSALTASPIAGRHRVSGGSSFRGVTSSGLFSVRYKGLPASVAAAGMSYATSASAQSLSAENVEVASDSKIRLGTFLHPSSNKPCVGVIKDGKIWSIADAVSQETQNSSRLDDMVGVISKWADIRSSLQLDPSKAISLQNNLIFLAPIPEPRGPIMCIGKNYVEHVKEVDTWKTATHITEPSIPQHPIVFTKAPQLVIGSGSAIQLPPPHVSSKVDYEAELALIIGREGKFIPEEKAMEHVFGYTILNDVTARDVQKLHQQWFLGKSCDTFCPMGPWIVPAHEIDGRDLAIQCWVNDELRQNGRTSQLIFSIPVLIATISKAMTLRPGDIIATGTPSGVGSGFNPPKHLKAGDSVRIRIEGIGEISNSVVDA